MLVVREVIALDQDPLGRQGYRYMTHPGKDIWVKELSGGEWAVCFLASGDSRLDLRIDWAHFPFLKGTYRIRDLWQKKDMGTTEKGLTARVAPHDVLLVKLSPLAN